MWQPKRMLLAAAAAALLLSAPSASSQKPNSSAGPFPIEVRARPLAGFELHDPERRRFAALEFRGGIALSSSAREFGGVSAIRLAADGERFLAITDKGYWLRGRLQHRGNAPIGVIEAEMARMLGVDGRPLTARRWYDSESMTLDGATAYVGFERVHQIVRFDYGKHGLLARGKPLTLPPELRNLPSNKGFEGMVIMPKGAPHAGAILTFTERALDQSGNIRAFLIGRRGAGEFAVKRSGEFDITDAALTPDGDVLILERRFSLLRGAGMRIRSIPLADVKPGAVVDGPVLIEADDRYQIDNMEGLSAHRGPLGETVLTIVSDDNFSSLQRTLLLQFTLLAP